MKQERWSEICTGFTAVLERGPDERADYMKVAFAHDADLRAQVAQLLRNAHEAETEGFLKEPTWILDDIPLFLPDFKGGTSEFRNIAYIGHGGMGVVYKAYQSNFDRWVAIKMLAPRLTTDEDMARFRREAQSMARLRHTNIVTVHETGEYQGRPFFVMDLIEGRSLSDRLTEFYARPKEAASLVQMLAFAIHHAHQRRILHNDLKPSNILLDAEGKPHISDFGLAKRFGPDQVTVAATGIEGTASYMSPEQADGKEVTTSSDVYGLGAILYTLLTGVPPFRAETAQGTLDLARKSPPAPPRLLNPKVDRTLEAICLKCLKKDKAERYASANSLAFDIGRYQDGRETLALPWNRRDRFVGWCKRNRLEAGLAAAVVVIWIFVGTMALSVAETRKTHLLDATKKGVSFAAKDLATTTLLQFQALSRNVELATADPKLAGLMKKDDRRGLQRFLAEACQDQPSPFQSCYILNDKGIMVAHIRLVERMLGNDFSWRDYFQSAKRLGELGRRGSVHISRVYQGRSDNLYKFAVPAPILNSKGRFLGIVATSVTTDSSLGPVFLHDERRQVALVAPRDMDDPQLSPESYANKYVVLFHPAYAQGIEPVEFPGVDKILAQQNIGKNQNPQLSGSQSEIPASDNFTDPVSAVSKQYGGRWIAGFAPVGNSGFVVVVQQRYDEAVSLEGSTVRNLAVWSGLASLVAVVILALVFSGWGQREGSESVLKS